VVERLPSKRKALDSGLSSGKKRKEKKRKEKKRKEKKRKEKMLKGIWVLSSFWLL